jgi:hypothetical protein
MTAMMIMEYFLTCPTVIAVHDAYLKHTRVHVLADKLGINGLKILAAEKLWLSVCDNWNVKLFIPCVKETYATTNKRDQTIRKMLVMAAHKNMEQLVKTEEFVEEFQDMGEFTAEFLMHVPHLIQLCIKAITVAQNASPVVNNSA